MSSSNENLVQAASILALTNICFKKCVMKHDPRKDDGPRPSTELLAGLGVPPGQQWLLSERETVCLNNCGHAYVELKDFLHEQFLKDYLYIRKKNRQIFENL